MEVSNSCFSERVDLGLSYFLRLAAAQLQVILWFALSKRPISSIINILGDIRYKRQRTIAIFLWTCAKTLQKKLKAEPSQLLQHWHSNGKRAGTLMRGRTQKMIELVLFKVSTQRRIYLWPKTRNEKLSPKRMLWPGPRTAWKGGFLWELEHCGLSGICYHMFSIFLS